ncbi:type VI secretion system baseplate subunit TssK [Colwellia sp. MB02u-10]|uniref:type VI secretion system baseplate subunit TssK n=1 Tax=Colwellia sp. MB02u-10 TaxID=2759828 RepID=UPI0015F719CD|nr:type VI secretion system baseplate subunit TssK [Colwellia sp. MB02u-10]MBA6339749.1 type VI secretion system baseplate subunit TssK [Colwellia sp. MB02u-10]
MNFQKPLLWHQGLFLQPQHFQYESLHSAQVTAQYMRQISNYPWGFSHLQLDETALTRGQIDIQEMEVLFEDGTLVEYPANAHLQPRNFDAKWIDRNTPLKVYIGLSKVSHSKGNVTVVPHFDSAPIINTRYIAEVEGEEYKDFHQGELSTHLRTMKYAINLLLGDEAEATNNDILIHIATLEQKDEEIKFCPNYITPCTAIKASTVLMSTLKNIRDELVGRSKQLEKYKSISTSRAAEFNPVAERYRSALKVLASYAPSINHHLENSCAHPVDIYGILRSLIGELSTFSTKVNLLGESADTNLKLPKYQHKALADCFSSAKELIITLLDELTVSPELLVRFEKEDVGRFSVNLPGEFFTKQNSMYLVLETNTPYNEFNTDFNSFAKLGADSQVNTYVDRAIPGLTFEHFSEQPTGLEHRAKVTYFTIDRDSDKWKMVQEQGKFALHWDDAPEDLMVEMVLVRG